MTAKWRLVADRPRSRLRGCVTAVTTVSEYGACLRQLRAMVAPAPPYAALARAALGDARKVTTVRNWVLGVNLPNEWDPLRGLVTYLVARVPDEDARLVDAFHEAFTFVAAARTRGRRARVPSTRPPRARDDFGVGRVRTFPPPPPGMTVTFTRNEPRYVHVDDPGSGYSVREDGLAWGFTGRYAKGCGI